MNVLKIMAAFGVCLAVAGCEKASETGASAARKAVSLGNAAAPLFRYLTDAAGFEGFPPDGKLAPILEKMLAEADPDYAQKPSIKWNFTKFLIGRDGKVIRRFEPTAPLADVEQAIAAALQAP